MKQLSLHGVTPFADAPIDAPDTVVTSCKSEAAAVRWCLDFALEAHGVSQRTVAKLCGWRSDSFLSEIANEASEKGLPAARIGKFTLATGCRLVEQYHERQRILRGLTGTQTTRDKSRDAVKALLAQYQRQAEAA